MEAKEKVDIIIEEYEEDGCTGDCADCEYGFNNECNHYFSTDDPT